VFAGPPEAQLATVAACGRNESLQSGSYLLREGRPAERFYLIRVGTVALEIQAPGRGAVIIETLQPGEVAGWSWLFAPYRWQFDARAVERCSVIAFDGACLRGKCDADHELGYELMRRFAECIVERLQATRLQLLDVYGTARAAT
jgi:CRP/FNR family transcriptional regulator, cyclic AMP receptor protein